MTDLPPVFRTVLRGFDPTEVESHIDDMQAQIDTLRASASATAASAPEAATYEHVGQRMIEILALAEAEAAELRSNAVADADAALAEATQSARLIRDQADVHAATTRANAEDETHRLLADARATADDLVDSANREWAARRQEGEALVEEQRAKASSVLADFEQTMSSRRDATAETFRAATAEHHANMRALDEHISARRAEDDAAHADAVREARSLLEDAQLRAATLVNDAKAAADRVRAESERELSAAVQRRDSINEQLTNVRQMLATLTGQVVGSTSE